MAALPDPEWRLFFGLARYAGLRVHSARLHVHGRRSVTFPWAQVGPEVIEELAGDAGLEVSQVGHSHGRWFAVLGRSVPGRSVPGRSALGRSALGR